MRRYLLPAAFVMGLTTPLTAFAQDSNCPPGAWFCEETDVGEPPEAEVEAEPEASPPPPPPRSRRPRTAPPRRGPPPDRGPPARRAVPHPRGAPPPVVVYHPGPYGVPPHVVIVTPGGAAAVVPPPPPPPKPRWRPEWGLNMRLEGVSLGRQRGAANNAGMGGLGVSLRYRPVPAFALDFGVDVLGGNDYNGFQRTEIPLSLSGILYVNPKSRVQFYFIGGMHVSHATVDRQSVLPYENQVEYTYFGGQGGMGLEFRLSKRVALNFDAMGFMRKRTDDYPEPEFVDWRTGQSTDSSGGGLFRGGLTFWW